MGLGMRLDEIVTRANEYLNSRNPLMRQLSERAQLGLWFAARRERSAELKIINPIGFARTFQDKSWLRSRRSAFPNHLADLLTRNDPQVLTDLVSTGVTGRDILLSVYYDKERRDILSYFAQNLLCIAIWTALVVGPTIWLGNLRWPHFVLMGVGWGYILWIMHGGLATPRGHLARQVARIEDRWIDARSDSPVETIAVSMAARGMIYVSIIVAALICLPFLFLILRGILVGILLPLCRYFPALSYMNGYGALILAIIVGGTAEGLRRWQKSAWVHPEQIMSAHCDENFDAFVRKVILKDPDWERRGT